MLLWVDRIWRSQHVYTTQEAGSLTCQGCYKCNNKMPFNVLKCHECGTFQVHPQTKGKKWRCKMCNENQSFLKVLFLFITDQKKHSPVSSCLHKADQCINCELLLWLVCLSDPPEPYQWESFTPGGSSQAEQVCGVDARLKYAPWSFRLEVRQWVNNQFVWNVECYRNAVVELKGHLGLLRR